MNINLPMSVDITWSNLVETKREWFMLLQTKVKDSEQVIQIKGRV